MEVLCHNTVEIRGEFEKQFHSSLQSQLRKYSSNKENFTHGDVAATSENIVATKTCALGSLGSNLTTPNKDPSAHQSLSKSSHTPSCAFGSQFAAANVSPSDKPKHTSIHHTHHTPTDHLKRCWVSASFLDRYTPFVSRVRRPSSDSSAVPEPHMQPSFCHTVSDKSVAAASAAGGTSRVRVRFVKSSPERRKRVRRRSLSGEYKFYIRKQGTGWACSHDSHKQASRGVLCMLSGMNHGSR